MGVDAGCVFKRPPQYGQCHVGILSQQFIEETAIRRKLAVSPGPTLRRGPRLSSVLRTSAPLLRATASSAPPPPAQPLFDVALEPNPKRQ